MTALWITFWLGVALASPPNTWAAQRFTELGARVVRCPAYMHAGENQPLCARTELRAETFMRAFDRVRPKELEPLGSWREDHGVWLRRYRSGAHHYAVVYTTVAQTFNVQVVFLKGQ